MFAVTLIITVMDLHKTLTKSSTEYHLLLPSLLISSLFQFVDRSTTALIFIYNWLSNPALNCSGICYAMTALLLLLCKKSATFLQRIFFSDKHFMTEWQRNWIQKKYSELNMKFETKYNPLHGTYSRIFSTHRTYSYLQDRSHSYCGYFSFFVGTFGVSHLSK